MNKSRKTNHNKNKKKKITIILNEKKKIKLNLMKIRKYVENRTKKKIHQNKKK